jgi:anaerobic ribonucleoside-triphosphate reductase
MVSSKKLVEEYINKTDWRVTESSSLHYSIGGLQKYIGGELQKDYWLRSVYPEKITKAYLNGKIHIHDLQGLTLYCCGYSLKNIIMMGVQGISNIPTSTPAQHFDSILSQVTNLVTGYQNEIMGAVAFNSFDTMLAPFIKVDNLNYKQVKQEIQKFIFAINSNSRIGAEPAFTNITFDLTPPEDLLNQKAIVGNTEMDFTYKECQKEIDMINKVFFELMIEGDANQRPFSYPIPTYNIHKRFDWDNPNNDLLWKMAGKFGYPYFANFLNSDLDMGDVRSMCCRLSLRLNELRKKNGGLFGAGDSTGCYDNQTEILTGNGWKYFKDLSLEDNIYTLSETNIVELYKPDNLFEYDWDNDLIEFKNDRFDLLVTPNHRMVCDDKNSFKRGFIRADEYSYSKHGIPKTGIWEGEYKEYFILPQIENQWIGGNHNANVSYVKEEKQINMNNWLQFMGLWLSEGSFDNENIAKSHGYRVIISQKKHTKEVEDVLKNLPFNYAKDQDRYIICNKQLWSYVKQLGLQNKRYIPLEYKILAKNQLQILFDYLMLGDGSISKKSSPNGKHQKTYYTSSKQLADDVQEMIIKLGYIANIKKRNPGIIKIHKKHYQTKESYSVNMDQSKHFYIRPNSINKKYYKGKVYCCEVKNNTIMVRRNGFVTWCGNSIGVVTINLPRIAYLNKGNKERFYKDLERTLNLAKESLEIKRQWLNNNIIDRKLIPAFCTYIGGLRNFFSTIGVVGMNEMCENFMDVDILTKEGKDFALEVSNFIRAKLIQYQEETGHLYNYEATPAESTCYRLAKKDKEEFDDIITRGTEDAPYYTNSCHIPVNKVESIKQLFDHQNDLQILFTGGTVIHMFLNGAIDGQKAKHIIKTVCEQYQVPYVSLSPLNRYCSDHGYVEEHVNVCPKCGKELDFYQRITGYLRNTKYFNDGKKAEFKERNQLNIW